MDEFTAFISACGAAVLIILIGSFMTMRNTDEHIAQAIKDGVSPLVAKCAFRDHADCKLLHVKQN